MPEFHFLNVKEIKKETSDTVSFFDVPAELKKNTNLRQDSTSH